MSATVTVTTAAPAAPVHPLVVPAAPAAAAADAAAAPLAAPAVPTASDPAAAANPLLAPWTAPHGLPPWAEITPAHFEPAFAAAFLAHRAEVDAIGASAAAPTFANTVAAFDAAGALLDRVAKVFSTLCLSVTSPELQAVELALAPRRAAHASYVQQHAAFFSRLEAVRASCEAAGWAGVPPEGRRLLERIRLDAVRAGAALPPAAAARFAALQEALSSAETAFAQNVQRDEDETVVALAERDLAGCPPELVAAARAAAVARGAAPGDGAVAVSLSRSLVEPLLTHAVDRAVRERVWRAWASRGELAPARDNKALGARILALRAEAAELLGYASFADYQTADSMAGSPARARELLLEVWPRAVRAAARERADLAAVGGAAGEGDDAVQPWDWRFYQERVRAAKYAFDDEEVRPYLSLDACVAAFFACARRLYGLRYTPRPDVATFHPDALAYDVTNERGDLVGVFILDNFARPGKASGAWMSELRTAEPGVVPVITNNNNFVKAPPGQPTLLSFDDVVTLFHEAGHGLHGTLSTATYRTLAGTSVLRDWVELPSQLMEHWCSEPAVLREHMLHVRTREPLPEALLAKIKAARNHDAGFAAVEYAACALLDLELHSLPRAAVGGEGGLDLAAFEADALKRLGMPHGIVMRHRLPHFNHIFSGPSYAAGYWTYLASEVLDADAFEAFAEAGDCFDPAVAARAKEFIYAAGNTADPAELFRKFRGRDPVVGPMLKKKGLLLEGAA